MITVLELEEMRKKLFDIFPNAVRGSVAKSRWGNGRKVLHLMYGFSADTAFGYKLIAKGSLYYFVDWDTNYGNETEWAESDFDLCLERIRNKFKGKILTIDSPVRF